MPKFRKKPVVIEAVQFDGDNVKDIERFMGLLPGGLDSGGRLAGTPWLVIPTLEGQMEATKGDWIIRGVQGEFYPCKPDIFEKTYDLVTFCNDCTKDVDDDGDCFECGTGKYCHCLPSCHVQNDYLCNGMCELPVETADVTSDDAIGT